MTEKTYAVWSISLDCDCPKCAADFDLLDNSDFWCGAKFQPIEHGTDLTTDVEAQCPECGHEFVVDFQY